MFGYVRPNLQGLDEAEKKRYHAVYCGLCRVLGDRFGFAFKFSLTYDLTFLILFLSSLYEPEEQLAEHACVRHPIKTHPEITNSITAYAADMTVALMYHKLMDDWMDDHERLKKGAANLMHKQYNQVRQQWPKQCDAIEQAMLRLSALEKENALSPDAAADCFGTLMASLFLWKEDFWQEALRSFGYSLGRFIYLADAAVDYKDDIKTDHPNPLKGLELNEETTRTMLMASLSQASAVLEELPLVQDIHILQNILYEGVWLIYNQELQGREQHD